MTKEETAAYNKAYCLENKEKIAEQKKAWYLENKEKRLEQVKAYYLANKEKHLELVKAWAKANPEKQYAHKKAYLLKLNLMNKNISQRTLRAWALQVKERDCYTCRDCGSSENLHAHHIWSKGSHPQYALDLDNGTTLCEECHIYEHQTNEARYIKK